VIGGFKISNPSFPSVHVALRHEQRLTLSWSRDLNLSGEHQLIYHFGLSYFDRKAIGADFDLALLSVMDFKDIATEKSEKGYAAMAMITYRSPRWFMPTVTLALEDLFVPKPEENQFLIDLDPYFQPRGYLSLVYEAPVGLGAGYFGVVIPFTEQWSQDKGPQTAVTVAYALRNLQSYASFSSAKTAVGFLFAYDLFSVGIQYTQEKQDNSIKIDREPQTNVFASIDL
jgi:hypothetical protein